eukprot:TRINITY_DN8573_c0_g1_i3.p1 TRINITY_DN8573_c0_g1~~TRINITY_DN8573_c0_g1_i3.p1  ORF type:complete len:145 (+),score=34.41 TRINITY_DN8573_c0_g1_i3:34-435(+)
MGISLILYNDQSTSKMQAQICNFLLIFFTRVHAGNDVTLAHGDGNVTLVHAGDDGTLAHGDGNVTLVHAGDDGTLVNGDGNVTLAHGDDNVTLAHIDESRLDSWLEMVNITPEWLTNLAVATNHLPRKQLYRY